MKVYLDNCVLNRPFDDYSDLKIRLEALAALLILALVEKEKIKLVNSSVIEYENSKNPFFERKIWISRYLSKASFHQRISFGIKQKAEEIERFGILPIDALHLASAESAGVDYFITCDYDIIRKYKGKLKVINSVDFIQIFQNK